MASISSYQTFPNSRKPIGKTISPLANSFSLVEMNSHFRFLIMDCPTDSTISLYLKEFSRLNVTDVVRVCESTYNTERLIAAGISVHNFPFKDGDVPSQTIVNSWLQLVNQRDAESAKKILELPVPTTIAVHCVAGLGRAPVLVAIALIEQGTDPVDAIELIRRKRRGAFNNKQITHLVNGYKRSSGKTRQNLLKTNTVPAVLGQKQSSSSSKDSTKSFFKKMFGSN
ncbi:hypothetical protein BB559_000247 [Furculomyces boomerangus]|uniref:protein-tyrosine-phosphatase n=2 Tax=Harpellales TaxID=61421 RepID=A0A2T9Z611_9FUNG|nr:hypothetical protein BB559_000247 [Furculomyces boomerangus]PVZ97179.1 hypothetical protein BB558_006873 [Smittium angustum]PWA00162.1 hypothetical protein BB558_003790 [Smittium angustum]